MKKLLIILLFIGFSAFGQTPNSTQKGYYLQMIGDSVVGQNTRPDKAFFDLYNYMKERKIKNGTVTSPSWEITIDYPDITKPDAVYINNGDISIGNQWMGEPIKIVPIYGKIITDNGEFNVNTSPDKAFDKEINTYSSRYNQALGWIGQDYEKEVSIHRFRFLPKQVANDAMKMNGALIQYSNDGDKWTTIHTIFGITETNFTNWVDVYFDPVNARMFRIYATQSASYCRVTELEFYTQL